MEYVSMLKHKRLIRQEKETLRNEASRTLNLSLMLLLKMTMCLLMVRFIPINPKPSIHLLQQNHPHQLVWKRHLRK